MNAPAIVWDWQPDQFEPPFTVRYREGLEHELADGTLLGDGPDVVSILAASQQQVQQGGKWFVVTAHRVPKGQRKTTAQSLKALCEMQWADYINQQENQS